MCVFVKYKEIIRLLSLIFHIHVPCSVSAYTCKTESYNISEVMASFLLEVTWAALRLETRENPANENVKVFVSERRRL